jgi:hypothetical protein
MGGGRSSLRFIRFGMLAVFLVLATTLHRQGSAYNTIHVIYFVVIAGLLVATFAFRGRGGGGGGRFGPRRQAGGGGTFGTGPPPRQPLPDNPEVDG